MNPKRRPEPPQNPGVRNLVQGKRAGTRPLPRENVQQGFQGWHENGYLPHRDEPGLMQFVTFRLADAFPETLHSEWNALLKIENDRQRRIELDAYLDKGHGQCQLRQREIAQMVEESLLFQQGRNYEMRAWVIMPNHVHLLFKVLALPMAQLLDTWKGYTAKQANRILGRRRRFWQEGYWDTYMRNEEHERRAQRYIEMNPAKAGLVTTSKAWSWSSARFRDDYNRLRRSG